MSKMMVKRDGLWTPMANLKGDTGPLPADNSVTNDALVTDGAKTNTAYLMGNRLTATAEGEMVSVDDSYPSAALSLTVDGKSTQVTTTGKNLLNPDEFGNGYINQNQTAGGTSSYKHSGYIPIEDGVAYTLSSETEFAAIWGFIYDEEKNVLASISERYQSSVVFNPVENGKYARVSFNNSQIDDVQFEKGSVATSYEPYSGGTASPRPDCPQEIESVDWASAHITGKNLFGGDDFKTALSKDSRITINEEGHYASYGASSGTVNLFDGVKFKEKTAYTIILAVSCTRENTPCNLRIGYTDGTYTSMAAPQFFDGETMQIFKFTSNASKTLKGLYRQNNGGATSIYYDYWGIFEGDADVDSYELYKGGVGSLLPEGTSLRSLPDGTKDELYLTYLRPSSRDGWAWYGRELIKSIDQMVLDGSQKATKANYRFYYRNNDIKRLMDYSDALLCDSLIAFDSAADIGGTYGFIQGISAWASNGTYEGQNWVYIALDTTRNMTAKELSQYLADNPITVQYPLATPITTQLDPIELPIMQAGTTNIWTDPSTSLSVTYERDRNIVISKLEAAAADLATS